MAAAIVMKFSAQAGIMASNSPGGSTLQWACGHGMRFAVLYTTY